MDKLLERFSTLSFAEPIWLLLLLALPLFAWLLGRPGRRKGVLYSSATLLAEVSQKFPDRIGRLRWVLPLLAVIMLILGIARPRVEKGEQTDREEGIDLMLVLDMSDSMRADDFILEGKPASRLEGLSYVVSRFVEKRPHDRIGVIGFAVDPYLMAPLTLDHNWVKRVLEDPDTGGGTAIGSGMVAAVETLQRSDAKTKIQIVVTDGINNKGVPPIQAAEIAAKENMRIYPIEILRYSQVSVSRAQKHPLQEVARLTGGQFFQAADLDTIDTVFTQIDNLEKSLIQQKRFTEYEEWFLWLVIPAALVLLLQFALEQSLWLRIP